MEMDKKTIIGIVLIVAVLVLVNTPLYKKTFFPRQYATEQARKEAAKRAEETGEVQEPGASEQIKKENDTAPARAAELKEEIKTEKPAEQESDKIVRESKDAEGITIPVETPLYSIALNTAGASLTSCRLKNYIDPDNNPVEIIGKNGRGNLAIGFTAGYDSIDTANDLFVTATREIFLEEGDNPKTIEFTLDLGDNKIIKKRYTFYPDKYSVDMEVVLENLHNTISQRQYTISWNSGMSPTEPRLTEDHQEAKVYYSVGSNAEKFDTKNKPNDGSIEGSIYWIGSRTKYFATAIIPIAQQGRGASFRGDITLPARQFEIWDKYKIEPKDRKWKSYGYSLHLNFLNEREKRDQFKIFLGPLDYEIVKQQGVGLEQMMSLGWKIIRPFSKIVLWCLNFLHGFIPNYGWVIVIFSIIVKIVLYPLTHKSYESMQKMQALQPKLATLKEKYAKDPQRLNQETMKMYKEQGVNPMGGCLPMLLQMPLLYALFIVFRSNVSLRGAEFIFWIKDLANPDTIAVLPFNIPMYGNLLNILPLLMGATMLIQQKMSMKDPKQKMMVYFMPIFLTLLFNRFPSGLNLYYMLFNLFSIFQQKLISDKMKNGNVPEQREIVTANKKSKK